LGRCNTQLPHEFFSLYHRKLAAPGTNN